ASTMLTYPVWLYWSSIERPSSGSGLNTGNVSRGGVRLALGMIGDSPEMQTVYHEISQVARTNITVLVIGETGTGKGLVARAIHQASERCDGPFVTVHCSALPESLIESELFGHVKGAFTGAMADRKGRFELADGGTLFLDEIAEISPAVQAKLLRVLQEREFERVGDTRPVRVNVRLIAATHRDLQMLVSQGRFREDLFYRLNVFVIHVPPLRRRRQDILPLADYFLRRYAKEQSKEVHALSPEVEECLLAHSWPGNVRELENTMERAVLVCDGPVILLRHLPLSVRSALPHVGAASSGMSGGTGEASYESRMASFEREILSEALRSSRGNVAAAARILKTTPRIVAYRARRLGLEPRAFASYQ
ncbi:MAG: sigma-54 dependent transcriptional regulator, partial [Kiritimatiellae bacterium]|nr:sigma-54 dependent transcriptional regulator [Kiritimatiellia bacterium]